MNEKQIAAIRDSILQTFQDPTADPITSVFVLGAMIILVLMAVLGLLLLITPKKRKIVKVRRYVRRPVEEAAEGEATTTGAGEAASASAASGLASAVDAEAEQPGVATGAATDENDGAGADSAEGDKPAAKKRFALPKVNLPKVTLPKWLTVGLSWLFSVPVLLVLAFATTYVITGTDEYCARTCHASQDVVRQAAELDHASCVSCHETPGIPGLFANSASRTRMAVAAVMDREPGGPVSVASANCSSCHGEDISATTRSERGLIMSHAEPDAAGVACTSCHEASGHTKRRDYSMSTCLTCHDAKQASAECVTCHSGDPYAMPSANASEESTQTMGSGDVLYPAVFISDTSCGGCHNEKKQCDTCHGIRMPHTPAFRTTGAHARAAAFDRKKLCFEKCHVEQECASACHIGNFNAHGDNWKVEHAKADRDSGCVCHAQRTGRTEPMCTLCHDF